MRRVTQQTKNELAKGTRVYWHDPDHSAIESDCSGPGTISVLSLFDENPEVDDDTIISVEKDSGGFVEATWFELSFLQSFVIRAIREQDDETGEPLYWSNEDGWVDKSTATVFNSNQYNLPIGGVWEEQTDDTENS